MNNIKYSMSFTQVVLGCALIFSTGISSAEPSSMVAFDAETRAIIKAGDATRGEGLSSEKKCTKCHGDAGIAEDDDEVNLAGQIPSYIFKQMKDYQNGQRDDRDMRKATKRKKLTDLQIADLAQYYGSLPLPTAAKTESEGVIKLVRKGDHTRMLKSCNSCHGQSGKGDAFEIPSLVGQKKGYFAETLMAMKEGDRANDVYSRMRLIAEVLTGAEIKILAEYYGQISEPEPAAAEE